MDCFEENAEGGRALAGAWGPCGEGAGVALGRARTSGLCCCFSSFAGVLLVTLWMELQALEQLYEKVVWS